MEKLPTVDKDGKTDPPEFAASNLSEKRRRGPRLTQFPPAGLTAAECRDMIRHNRQENRRSLRFAAQHDAAALTLRRPHAIRRRRELAQSYRDFVAGPGTDNVLVWQRWLGLITEEAR